MKWHQVMAVKRSKGETILLCRLTHERESIGFAVKHFDPSPSRSQILRFIFLSERKFCQLNLYSCDQHDSLQDYFDNNRGFLFELQLFKIFELVRSTQDHVFPPYCTPFYSKKKKQYFCLKC